ncbi:MAG: ATP-binding protein [Acidimicrobiales bacterium]
MKVEQGFHASESSVASSRRFAYGTIADLSVDIQEAVALMVSELATNAVVHAGGGFKVTIDRTQERLLVAIADTSDQLPLLRFPLPSTPHGRGLRIVKELSDEWGTTPAPDGGKTIWFQMNLVDHHEVSSGPFLEGA